MGAGEFDIIERYFRPLTLGRPEALSLLDDAAFLNSVSKDGLVLTKDTIVEGVHFLPDTPADLIGRKALRTNLSDLASKGAKPLAYLMSLGVPKGTSETWFRELSSGLAVDQEEFELFLIGGDTVTSLGGIFISITMIGEAGPNGMIQRAGARNGDNLFVTGTIGDGCLGLKAARNEISSAYLENRYEVPEARVSAIEPLRCVASAAMDISDGLIADLGHLIKASRCGIRLDMDKVPLSTEAQALVACGDVSLMDLLTGGDDYEILFTSKEDMTSTGFSEFNCSVTRIGTVTEGGGLTLWNEGSKVDISTIDRLGHDHFGPKKDK